MAEVKKVKLVLFLVGSVLLISFIFYAYQIVYVPNILVEGDDRVFIVKPGSSYQTVLTDLGKGHFVNDMVSFSFLARLSGYDKKIIPGRFILRKGMTNLQAIKILKTGKQEPVKITFSYVRLTDELAEKLTRNIGVSQDEFLDALNDFVENNNEGFTKENVRCMFLPNTYEVYFNVQPSDLIEKMHEEFNKFWNEKRKQKAKDIGLTPIEVSILASIVQAETVKQDEAPLIAGLYLNRLKKDIALQADPTLVYASGDFGLKRVLNGHKEIDSPYNTYKNAGLPPGPINVPQIASIDAVLNYKKSDYYYMCAKEDFSGYHNFAANLSEHNVNARKYQKALTAEMKKAEANKK
ncbi:MAG: endolytic transglycosylase MltG [Cyclobacteriaceae bacterium]|nr:endolytic transglycosylase MltG [Cyclobacteriaceae bacterium]